MITILSSGKLNKPPRTGQSAKGTAWTSATVRAAVTGNRGDEPDSTLINLIAFGAQAEKLAGLAAGDSVAFTGDARPTARQRDDVLHAGLSCNVSELLTPYGLKQRREGHHETAVSQAQTDGYDRLMKRQPEAEYDDPISF